jgi:hypothetical protein
MMLYSFERRSAQWPRDVARLLFRSPKSQRAYRLFHEEFQHYPDGLMSSRFQVIFSEALTASIGGPPRHSMYRIFQGGEPKLY